MDGSLVLLEGSSLVRFPSVTSSGLRGAQWSYGIGHVVPEALLGGPIALVKDGDAIIIDSETRTINWKVDEAEQERRKKEWDAAGPHEFREKRGILYKYARDVAVSFIHSLMVAPSSSMCLWVVACQRWGIHGLECIKSPIGFVYLPMSFYLPCSVSTRHWWWCHPH